MKTILFLLVVASLAFAQKPAPNKNRQVLLDFRVNRNVAPAAIPAATQRYVLSKVFRRYLTDANRCNAQFDARGDADPLAAARKAGQIVPEIFDSAKGSFTAAGQSQTLYVISVSECNASHADNFGTKRVAIFAGQQLIAEFDVNFYQSIIRKTDLDGDGIDELLMTHGYTGQGTVTESAALLSFQNGRLRVIEDFGVVSENSCASGFPGSAASASVLYIADAVPAQMPTFPRDNYAATCRSPNRWKFVSSGKIQ
ncbi:MAG TPA: hypothetical protein VFS77_04755 [Pyrinomonadaceae bacterium]|nr:hypothetical protein [Pyrinomonadaceae bacterium]